MLKLLLLAGLVALLGRMVADLWRHWLQARFGPPAGREGWSAPSARLRRCDRCGVYSPPPQISLPGARFLCRQCRKLREP